MAGGGDSVAGVILLSFPQTGAGCRFKALVSVFQQAGSKRRVIPHASIYSLHYLMAFMVCREGRAKAASGGPGLVYSC